MQETWNDDDEYDTPLLIEPDADGCALVVVDVQEKLIGHIHGHEDLVMRVNEAIAIAGHLGMNVVATEQYRRGLGTTIETVKQALAETGADAAIEKMSFSCFGEPAFVAKLEELAVETLIVVGVEAHVCVMQTVLDALERGFSVMVIAEGTGSRNPRHRDEALERMRAGGARVGSVEMFAFEALRTAEHPAFQKIRKVIV